MKLIYHPINTLEENSPFEEAMASIVRENEELLLVCPYINLDYLKKITGIAQKWRLLTDVEELIDKNPQKNSLGDFIKQNRKHIRHVKNIHAKVALTKQDALLGSANFTKYGFALHGCGKNARHEISILFDNEIILHELWNWFETLWDVGTLPSIKELNSFMKKNRERHVFMEEKLKKLTPVFNVDARSIIKVQRKNVSKPRTAKKTGGPYSEQQNFLAESESNQWFYHEQKLIKAIRLLKRNKEWIDQYFDLVKQLFLKFGLSEDASKFPLTITRAGYDSFAVNIGPRYVLKPYPNGDVQCIMPEEFEKFMKDYKNAQKGWEFSNTQKVKDSFGVIFYMSAGIQLEDSLRKFWEMAIKKEIDKGYKAAKAQKSHNPAYYKAVMDPHYREKILNVAYS